MAGSYSSVAQRGTLSSTARPNYYIKLRYFYNKSHIPVLNDSHNLEIRVPLTNVVALSCGTGTAAATINFAYVVCKVLKIPSDIASDRLDAMVKNPEQSFYHSFKILTICC